MPTETPSNDVPIDVPAPATLEVVCRDMPAAEFEELRAFGFAHGIGQTNTDILRWAAMSWLRTLRAHAPARPASPTT